MVKIKTMRSKVLIIVSCCLEVELTQESKGDFSYKEVSEVSDVTGESFPEGYSQVKAGAKDLENYEKLMEQTRQKLKILDGNV